MKKYWKSLEELKDIQGGSNVEKKPEPEFSIEGLTEQEVSSKSKATRRDFLKKSTAAAAAAAR